MGGTRDGKRGGDHDNYNYRGTFGTIGGRAAPAVLNQGLDDTNTLITDTNTLLSETNSRLDKVIFMLFGIGAGVIATLATVIFSLITGS